MWECHGRVGGGSDDEGGGGGTGLLLIEEAALRVGRELTVRCDLVSCRALLAALAQLAAQLRGLGLARCGARLMLPPPRTAPREPPPRVAVGSVHVSPLHLRVTLASGGMLLQQWRRVLKPIVGELRALPLSFPAYRLRAPPPHAAPRTVRRLLVWHYGRHLGVQVARVALRGGHTRCRWWLPLVVALVACAVCALPWLWLTRFGWPDVNGTIITLL